MSFTAKFNGLCRSDDCDYGDNVISQGDELDFVDGEIMHTSCATRAKRQPPLCNTCQQYHRGECA
jgi:hypothetical protein